MRRLFVLLALLCGTAFAQQYPTKPVKIVVPFAPGGNLDVTARIVAEAMARDLGQPFIVENRAGAGGVIGSEAVATAAPDGYTLLIGTTGTTVVSPLLVPSSPYKRESFAPIGMLAIAPLVLEVNAASPFADFKAFVANVKANPGKVSIGHSGNGTTNHIAILQLQEAIQGKFNIIAYKGSGPMLIDLIGRQIDSGVDQTTSSLPNIKAGKLRALAVGTRARIADLPQVPTFQEQGLASFEAATPSGLFAPAKTPAAIVRTLSAAVSKALADPGVKQKLSDLGSVITPMSAEQFDQFLKNEEVKLQALVTSGVLKGD